jgi:hypothetical protein
VSGRPPVTSGQADDGLAGRQRRRMTPDAEREEESRTGPAGGERAE